MKHQRISKPLSYRLTMALIQRIGVIEVLAAIKDYAYERYYESNSARYHATKRIGEDPYGFRPTAERTRLERQSDRWMTLTRLDWIIREFTENSRTASMSDEQLAEEKKQVEIAKLTEQLERVRKAGIR